MTYYSNNNNAEILTSATREGHRCYIDNKGNILLETKWRGRAPFRNGRSVVFVDKKWGFIDLSGNLVIPAKFDDCSQFNEGYCGVSINGKWGFINKDGAVVIAPEYEKLGDFSCGLAAVQRERLGDISYINNLGTTIIKDSGSPVLKPFSEGLLPSLFWKENKSGRKTCKAGYRDTTGEWALAPNYYTAHAFSEGLAGVCLKAGKEPKTAFIDQSGSQIIPPLFVTVQPRFCDSLAVVCKYGDGNYMNGCINRAGELVIPFEYYMIENFSEGLAAVQIEENGKWGYLNTKGEMQIEPRFDEIGIVEGHFRNGLALVEENSKQFYINKYGEKIWENS